VEAHRSGISSGQLKDLKEIVLHLQNYYCLWQSEKYLNLVSNLNIFANLVDFKLLYLYLLKIFKNGLQLIYCQTTHSVFKDHMGTLGKNKYI
jgi:hypothetical protein